MIDEGLKTNELVTIQKAQVMDVFTKRELITPLLEKIEHVATKETFDVNTDKGRKAIASMAYRVTQSKIYIEIHGKELAAELKELPKLVDSNRKYAKDFLNALKDKVRKPLDEWEAEQARIKFQQEIEIAHVQALIDNAEWDEDKKQKRLKEEQERKEYEERLRKEAAEKATLEAENKAKQAIIEAKARQMAAEQEAKRIQEQAQRDIELAEQRANQRAQEEADKLAKEQRIKAQQERDRLLRLEQEKMEKQNVDKVHCSIIEDFISIKLNEKQAQYILNAIVEKKIRSLKIEY